jgi:hypothetical protein
LLRKGKNALDVLRNRFASTQNLTLVFSTCAFPIYVWSILHVLYQVPAWVMQLNTWDLIGLIAYTQAFALIETIVVFFMLVLLSAILPAWFLRDRFVAQASMIILLSSAWSIVLFYNTEIINRATRKTLVFWFAAYLASIGVFYVPIQRCKKLEALIRSIVERLQVLSFVYVTVGFLSVIIVILRNA